MSWPWHIFFINKQNHDNIMDLHKLPESSSADNDFEVSESKAWGGGRYNFFSCWVVGVSGRWIKSQTDGTCTCLLVHGVHLHRSKVPLLSCGPRFFFSDSGKQPSSGFSQPEIYNMLACWDKVSVSMIGSVSTFTQITFTFWWPTVHFLTCYQNNIPSAALACKREPAWVLWLKNL